MAKRILATLLCAVLLMATVPGTMIFAKGDKDPMDNFVLYTIHEKKQFNPMANGYGSAWVSGLSMDVSDVAPENLALSLRFYFEDNNNPQNTSLLTAPNRDLKVATAIDGGKHLIWKADKLTTVTGEALKPGVWNDILLPFATGQNYSQFDFSKDILTFFWFEFNGMSNPGNYTVRLADVAVVDMVKGISATS
ncbi:MAG: hypothetical protein J6R77_07275 [Clostridia bacterium]|nr:hypothetical protein [Clostridia bacterium]